MVEEGAAVTQKLALGFFLLALVVGTALRLISVANKHTWDQDESILFLHATGRNDEFELLRNAGDYPFEFWSTVADWTPYITVTEPLNIPAVSYSMAFKDSHPPFYVWLLHLGMVAVGTHAWLGPALNLLLLVPLVLLVLLFARRLLGGWTAALTLTGIWYLRPAPVEALLTGRYYILLSLLALLVACLVWRGFYCAPARAHSWRQVALLAVVMAAGWLTHIYFPLVMAAAVLAVGLRWGPSRRLAGVLTSAIGGGVLFVLAFPQVFLLLSNLGDKRGVFDWRQIDDRLTTTVNETLALFVDGVRFDLTVSSFSRLVPWATLVLAAVVLVALLAYRRRTRLARWRAAALASESGWSAVYLWVFIVVVAGGQLALYMAFLSPDHAMSARYLTMPFVFLVFVPFLLARALPRRFQPVANAAIGVYAALSLLGAVQLTANGGVPAFPELQLAPDAQALAACDTIVTDNNYREIMLALALHLQPDDRVFAGRQDALLADPPTWLPELLEGGLYVTAGDQRSGTLANRDAILALLRAQGATVTRAAAPWIFETYVVAGGC